jgi:hypothetical protein
MKKNIGKNISIEWKFKLKDQIKNNFSNRQWADLTQQIINNKILRLIDKGLSPVEGQRMFQKYKNPEKYPGDLKSQNKPNLALTGSMLSNYDARPTGQEMTISLGIHRDTNELDRIKAKANNEGTETSSSKAARQYLKLLKNKSSGDNKLRKAVKENLRSQFKGIVARRFVPIAGETYTRQILLEIRKAFAYCLKQALQRGRNK